MSDQGKTFLCISNFFKGNAFLTELKKQGNRVYLITSEKLKDQPWAFEYIDEVFYMPGQDLDWDLELLMKGVGGLMKQHKIESIIALDDYDVEKATFLRESLRIPGMGQTTGRFFRDKLAMRIKAHDSHIMVPPFAPLFNDDDINQFADHIPAPWVLKPRSEASAHGIIKVHDKESLWENIHQLGDNRLYYLVEQFKPGDVYHVDGLMIDGKNIFCSVSRYLSTPMEISQGGGIFRSANLKHGSEDEKALKKANAAVMKAFGMKSGATHTEFIKCREDGEIYFLETSSRVGGAHLAEMVEAATDINLWAEWARIEDSIAKKQKYQLPKVAKNYAGILLTLSKYQHPDLSSFDDSEVYFRVPLEYHAGMIVKSKDQDRIMQLLDEYAARIANEFSTVADAPELKKFH
ncbi:ATP-grasp domain-containing protein [Algoriphagus ratkowskyi]|uniref:ATP-grasp domain-containing protein n=1 Tax=Algoriphagus ratkowskyi TaxID=57028 RepID=A0A2W7QX98_9BACT|nr:ATP-grasp domain-containing protein [Algoriphagus ratkowskyi]PZX50660.1 ATP-grasp domain-containing protein [Algoriphagus ratkowskyi]TXD80017.1 ATP-grasp domain-containing protein [Algoriphagus ratkowskyi]